MYVISSFWYQFVISKTIIIIVARNMQVSLHIHCKNKLVVLTTEWLPWLQTNWRDSGR